MNDSLALLIASVASVFAGALRLKLTAVWFSAEITATVSQLTQLYVLIFTFATLGLSTGIRVALVRTVDAEARAELARRLVGVPVTASVALGLLAQPFAGMLAERFLHDRQLAGDVRIAVLAAVPAVAVQTLSAVLQTEFEFVRLALATVGGAFLGCAAIALAASSHSVRLVVSTIPLLPVIQLLVLLAVSPRARSTAKFGRALGWVGLGPVFQIGFFSFLLAGADTLGDTLVRGALVARGGLHLVAQLQPLYLLTGQAFTLVLGSVSSALMVHVARGVREGTTSSAELNRSGIRFVVAIAGCALAAQALIVLIVRVLFSGHFLNGVDVARIGVAAEPLNALAWAYGAVLLPLGRGKAWLGAGLATVASLFGSALLLLPYLGARAVAVSYFIGWGVSAVGTSLALRRTELRPSSLAWAVVGFATAALVLTAELAGPGLVAWQPALGAVVLAVCYLAWQRSSTRAIAVLP